MFPNAKGSEELSILPTIDPVSQGAGTVTTGWVALSNFHALLATVETGVIGASGTLDAKLQQAQDNVGTGAKDVATKTIAQILKATGDNKQAFITMKPEDLDNINGFLALCDALITMLIAAARQYAEQLTKTSFITQQWSLVMDAFPDELTISDRGGRTTRWSRSANWSRTSAMASPPRCWQMSTVT